MHDIVIKNGHVIDPGNIDGNRDIYISKSKIAEILPVDQQRKPIPASRIIDAAGMIVTPGLIDMHVHFRDPGFEYKETIETGCNAAAAGGFTAVCTMPNTNPVNDNGNITRYIREKAGQVSKTKVYPAGAISRESKGIEFCDYEEMKREGAVAVTDDGLPVMDSLLMRRAMEKAGKCGLTVISHCEDMHLAAGGVMNEGSAARRLGLPGISNQCESIMVQRDIALAELTKTPIHIAHVSTLESVRAIRDAKRQGLPVTAETAPHYFTLTDEAVETYGANAKMNPPLRSFKDMETIRKGLRDGTIDVISTDHAPHSPDEKKSDIISAPNGIIGLETSLPIGLKLVSESVISITELINKMSINPARILGLETGIKIGMCADLTIIDQHKEYHVDSSLFNSLSRNTPFDGWDLKGKAIFTLVSGKIIYQET